MLDAPSNYESWQQATQKAAIVSVRSKTKGVCTDPRGGVGAAASPANMHNSKFRAGKRRSLARNGHTPKSLPGAAHT